MALTYPGVYIEEFTPAPPIEGVGASTVAFIGTAAKGPAELTRLHSWEAFRRTYGGFLVGPPASHLAPAVFGFFLNGGTDCFVLRATTAKHSFADLLSRRAGSFEAVLVAESVEEGLQGDTVTVTVTDASLLDDALGSGASTIRVHRADRPLAQPLATGPGADRTRAQVDDHSSFRIGEVVQIAATGVQTQRALIVDKQGTKTLIFADAVSGGDSFTGGSVRSVDLVVGQKEIAVEVPAGLNLASALPHGATVRIDDGAASPDVRTVDRTQVSGSVGVIVLEEGLKREYGMATAAPTVASLEFDLTVSRPKDAAHPNATPEQFLRLAMHPEHPRSWSALVRSEWIRLIEPETPPAAPDADPRPRPGSYSLRLGADDDRGAAWSLVLGQPTSFLSALDAEEEIDIVAIPGATQPSVQGAIRDYCERSRRFGILDSDPALAPDKVVSGQADKVRSEGGYVALYFPWVQVAHPTTGRTELWPPSGHIAGLYARSDARKGVHAAPANDILRGTIGLQHRLSNDEQGALNLKGVNVLRVFPGQATPVVWGARTTGLDNKYWQYVNIRRLFLFLEKSIEQNIRWAVFRPNDLALWQELKRVIGDFLTKAWKDGALFGATAKQAFYVLIDEALNPESERALGRLHIEIGVAPTYPAEFIVVRIGIWTGGSETTEA